MNTFELIHLEFSSQLHAQQTFFDQHINKSLPFPSIPSRLLHGGLQLLRSLPLSDQSSLLQEYSMIVRKYLRGLKYFTIPMPLYASPPPSSSSHCLTTAQIDGFIDVRDRFSVYTSSTFHVEPSVHSGVMDNSANIHVIKDKHLFTSDIHDCPLGVDIGTVIRNRYGGNGLVRQGWHKASFSIERCLISPR